MNLFAEIFHSIYDSKSYVEFRKNKTGRTFLYGVLLNLICVLLVLVFPVVMQFFSAGGIKNWVKASVPDFKLENGTLWLEEPVKYADMMVYFQADTSQPLTQEITKTDLLAFEQAFVIDAQHAMIKAEGEVFTVPFAELEIDYLDRDVLLQELFPTVYVILGVLLLFVIWVYGIRYFGGAFLTALIGKWMASAMRYRISFGDLYKLAVHARTTPLLLQAAYMFAPLVIPFFEVITLLVSALYMKGALRQLKLCDGAEEKPGIGF